ncbi:MAG: DMT family transporter [Bacteroidales bacterium]|nr:DMT family transporter [Bacteroidales bacterium]
MKKQKSYKYLPQLLLTVSSAFWGASFIFTKGLFLTEESITPTIILTGRMLIASLFTVPLLALTHRLQPIRKGHLPFFLLLAFAEPFLYSICETSGVRYVSGSLASIIVATIPLFIPFGMAMVYKERLSVRAVVGVVLSLVGIAMMSLDDNFSFTADPRGLALLALAVLIAVVYTLTLVKILDHYNPMTITCYQNLIGFIYFLPVMLLFDGSHLPQLSFTPRMWLMLAFLGVFCSTLAYMFFNYGMKHLGATAGSVYNNAIPVFSLLLALAIGQERMSWMKLAGMAVVLVGLTVAQNRKNRFISPSAQ